MVPSVRLIWLTALLALPAGLLAIVPEFHWLAAVLPLALAAAALADLALGVGNLAEFGLASPHAFHLVKDAPGEIELALHAPRGCTARLRAAVAFPLEVLAEKEEITVELKPDADASARGGTAEYRLRWRCTARRRGCFPLRLAALERGTPLGLWEIRRRLPLLSEIRVYPNLAHDRKQLAGYFLNRGMTGMHLQRLLGQGREFEKLRDYLPGDSYDQIHWKATAKRGRPVTKEFQVERAQEVYLVIDASRLNARAVAAARGDGDGPEPATMLDEFVSSALVMGAVAERQGDLFGLLVFSDKVKTFIRAQTGRVHYNACRDALYTLRPDMVSPDFDELASFIRLRLRRRALLVFLTSLDDPLIAEQFAHAATLLGREHLVLANMVRPEAARELFTEPVAGGTEELYARLGGHLQWHGLRELQDELRRKGVAMGLLDSRRLCLQLVAQYANVKQRQAL